MNDDRKLTLKPIERKYDRKVGECKPTSMEHVRVGGWAEVFVGEWTGDNERWVFGYIVRISGHRIILRIADEVFSPAKTGLRDGEEIEVDLEDISGSEFSPFQIELEARGIQDEIMRQLIDEHQEEFNAFCPSEYAISRLPLPASSSPEERHAWCRERLRICCAFVDQLIRPQMRDGESC